MSAYIILLNLPGNSLTIDGTEVEIQGGFRGFHSVPPGKHQISMEGYSGQEITLDLELANNGIEIRKYKYDTQAFEQVDSNTEENYWRLALSGAMGIALWPYPPSLRNITNSDLIASIFESAKRLKFLLKDRYEIALTDVKAIGVGNDIISIRTSEKSLFFQIAGKQEVLTHIPQMWGEFFRISEKLNTQTLFR